MRRVLQRIDTILGRIPADSRIGRGLHEEMVDHLGDAAAGHVAEGKALEVALADALDDFGPSEELEPSYYRDYVRSRYLWGWIDREAFQDARILRTLGVGLLLLGVVCYQLLPTVAAHAGAMAVVDSLLQGALAEPDGAREVMERALEHVLPFEIDPRIGGVRLWGVAMAAGLLSFLLSGARSLRRLRLQVSGAEWVLLGMVGVGAASSLVLTLDPARYASAFVAALFLPESGDPARSVLGAPASAAFATALALLAGGVWVWFRAWRAGVADTFLLRQGAVWLVVLAGSVLAMSHGLLSDGLQRMSVDPDAIPPAQLYGLLTGDLLRFVVGTVGSGAAVLGLGRVFAAADRVFLARGGRTAETGS